MEAQTLLQFMGMCGICECRCQSQMPNKHLSSCNATTRRFK